MLTQCPSCQTTFRVTSEILRVARGQVRCGRCQTQFDALARLIEEAGAGAAESGRHLRPPRSAPAAPSIDDIEVEEPVSHEDITLEGRRIEISGTYQILDGSGRSEPQVRQEVTEEWIEIDGLEDAVPADQELADAQTEYQDRYQIADPTREAHPIEAEAEPGMTDAAFLREAGDTGADPAADFELLPRPRRSRAAPVWKILAGPLALLMIVQLVHNYRSTLARHPRLGTPLMRIYSSLGLPLQPDWNLHAYEIRQWGVASDPAAPGTLKVRASIRNVAPFAQPYPLLKLVLEDRWGEQVRAREFEPAEYLDPTTAPDRLLAPAQQTNATVVIVDPGPDAEGFRFDACLRGANGAVCAAEIPR